MTRCAETSDDTKVIVLSAPSGAGKTTIANHLVDDLPVTFATSATTRKPRSNETHGKDYYFYTESEFQERVQDNAFIEYEEVHNGTYYGTLKDEVDERSQPVLLDIDVKGGITVKDIYGDDALLLFIAPPSLDALERRLRRRGATDEAERRRRLQRATMEMTYQDDYDEVVVNDDLSDAVTRCSRIIKAFIDEEKNT